MAESFFIDSSAVLVVNVYDEDGVTPADATALTWRAVDPKGLSFIDNHLPSNPTPGQTFIINKDTTSGSYPGPGLLPGSPISLTSYNLTAWDILEFDNSVWTKIGTATSTVNSGEGKLIIPPYAFKNTGLYSTIASFSLSNGITSSVEKSFEILDPLGDAIASTDPLTNIVSHAWMKFEDIFDSELGGPWLRDKTKAMFNKDKMARLLPDALYYINNYEQPITSFDETSFPFQQHGPLLTQALLVESIYHLIRSYTEQRLPMGPSITYLDRRDYLQRWQQVLIGEEKKFQTWLGIFKLQYTEFGSSAILVGGYASSLVRTPAAYRARYPRYITPYRAL